MLEVLLIIVVTIAVATDLVANKIYNLLCLFGLCAGFTLQLIIGDWAVAGMSLLAALVAGLIFLPFYLMGGMAAGDVKLMSATAAIIGWPHGVVAAGVSLICGTVLGVVYYCARGGAKEFFIRYSAAVRMILGTGSAYLPAAPENSIAKTRFPYALAIATGCLLTQYVIVR